MTVTVQVPHTPSDSDRHLWLERAARLRCMADALEHDVRANEYAMTVEVGEESMARVDRWRNEAAALEAKARGEG